MIELRFQDGDASRIIGELVGRETERCAILWASRVALSDDWTVLSSTRIEFPDDDNYSDRSALSAQLKAGLHCANWQKPLAKIFPPFLCILIRVCSAGILRNRRSMARHIWRRFLSVRAPHTVHGAVVVSAGGWCARRLGEKTPMRVVSVGPRLQVLFDDDGPSGSTPLKFDRQVRALGSAGQKILSHSLSP